MGARAAARDLDRLQPAGRRRDARPAPDARAVATAAYNATNPFALALGRASGRKAGKTGYVLCHQPQSFDWRARGAKRHPAGKVADAAFVQACAVRNQIIAIE